LPSGAEVLAEKLSLPYRWRQWWSPSSDEAAREGGLSVDERVLDTSTPSAVTGPTGRCGGAVAGVTWAVKVTWSPIADGFAELASWCDWRR